MINDFFRYAKKITSRYTIANHCQVFVSN